MSRSLVEFIGRLAPLAFVSAVAPAARGIAEEFHYHSESALIPLLLLLLVLLGVGLVVIRSARVIRWAMRRLRRDSAAPQSVEAAPEQSRAFEASSTAVRDPASRRIAAIDPGSVGTAASRVATIAVGVLFALFAVPFLAVGVWMWRVTPSGVAAWFVVVASLFIVLAAYRPLKQILDARRRRGFVFVMDQVPIGGAVGGTLEFPAGRRPAGPVEATLACLSVRRHLRGRVNRPDLLTLWSQARTIQTTGTSDRLSVSFGVPSELPSSDPSPGLIHVAIVWRLTVAGKTAGGPGNIAFVLPVRGSAPAAAQSTTSVRPATLPDLAMPARPAESRIVTRNLADGATEFLLPFGLELALMQDRLRIRTRLWGMPIGGRTIDLADVSEVYPTGSDAGGNSGIELALRSGKHISLPYLRLDPSDATWLAAQLRARVRTRV